MRNPKPIFMEEIKAYLSTYYEPTTQYVEASVKENTEALYELLYKQFPVEGFTMQALYTALKELGFSYTDAGGMNPEWLLKAKRQVL